MTARDARKRWTQLWLATILVVGALVACGCGGEKAQTQPMTSKEAPKEKGTPPPPPPSVKG